MTATKTNTRCVGTSFPLLAILGVLFIAFKLAGDRLAVGVGAGTLLDPAGRGGRRPRGGGHRVGGERLDRDGEGA